MPSNGECITLCIGQAGRVLGARSFFSDTHADSPQFVPRAVFVDTDPSTRNEMLTGMNKELFHPESILGYKLLGSKAGHRMQDCKNIFFEGRHMASDAGFKPLGFDLWSKVPRVTRGFNPPCEVIYPSNQFSSSIVEPYNCIFSTYYMRDAGLRATSPRLPLLLAQEYCQTGVDLRLQKWGAKGTTHGISLARLVMQWGCIDHPTISGTNGAAALDATK
eukprot:Skav213720  [mRNA]  locus=scaffold2678:260272:279196:- [translate_table: standard]